MPGIKAPITDILTQLRTLTDFQFVRVWNNQLQYQEQQTIYSFPYPACFLETLSSNYTRIGAGASQSDVTFRIHIAHEYYDATDGTMEQDLVVFDLRDKVIALLSNFTPTACSILNVINEQQDYDHSNVYHYIVDFNCAFIDDKGSKIYVTKSSPTLIEIDFVSQLVNETIITEVEDSFKDEAGPLIVTEPHRYTASKLNYINDSDTFESEGGEYFESEDGQKFELE